MAHNDEVDLSKILGGEGKSLGASDLNETIGRVLGFRGNEEASQGGTSYGDFDPTSVVIDGFGIMQAAPAPAPETPTNSGGNNSGDNSSGGQQPSEHE